MFTILSSRYLVISTLVTLVVMGYVFRVVDHDAAGGGGRRGADFGRVDPGRAD